MRLGYVATALALECRPNRRFRLASYSESRLVETITANLACLSRTLRFSRERNMLFFRIGSELIPFASHPVCTYDWHRRFRTALRQIGREIRAARMRISMHPGQFVVLNSADPSLFQRSVAELRYHTQLLDAMELDEGAKIQVHVGGVYGDRERAMAQFCDRYSQLDDRLRARLVIENDDRRFALRECIAIHRKIGIPVVFDLLHHRWLNHGEPIREAMLAAFTTWRAADGPPMIDYSTQEPGRRRGTHASRLDESAFRGFIAMAKGLDFDIMFELRNKEASPLKALSLLEGSRMPTRHG